MVDSHSRAAPTVATVFRSPMLAAYWPSIRFTNAERLSAGLILLLCVISTSVMVRGVQAGDVGHVLVGPIVAQENLTVDPLRHG